MLLMPVNIVFGDVDSRSIDNAPLYTGSESRRIGEIFRMVERYVDEIKVRQYKFCNLCHFYDSELSKKE